MVRNVQRFGRLRFGRMVRNVERFGRKFRNVERSGHMVRNVERCGYSRNVVRFGRIVRKKLEIC